MLIRDEAPFDIPAIRALVERAFRDAAHGSGTEAAIVDALREDAVLSVSLLAEDDTGIIGHVTFSPVTINGEAVDWYGLGPIAVRADRRRRGVGARLIRAGLERVKGHAARGCVVLGDPAYYGRFGFRQDAALRYPGAPSHYFQCLVMVAGRPQGIVDYHPAFSSC